MHAHINEFQSGTTRHVCDHCDREIRNCFVQVENQEAQPAARLKCVSTCVCVFFPCCCHLWRVCISFPCVSMYVAWVRGWAQNPLFDTAVRWCIYCLCSYCFPFSLCLVNLTQKRTFRYFHHIKMLLLSWMQHSNQELQPTASIQGVFSCGIDGGSLTFWQKSLILLPVL